MTQDSLIEKLAFTADQDITDIHIQNTLIFRNKTDFTNTLIPPLQEPKTYAPLQNSNIISKILTTQSNDNFTLWHSEQLDPNKKTFIFFPGNGGHLGYSPTHGWGREYLGAEDAFLQTLKEANNQNYNVIAPNYVGYPGSTNETTSEAQIYKGLERTIDWALEQNLPPHTLHLAGVSLGTTMATYAANYLADTAQFQNQPKNQKTITLLLMNGILDAPKTGMFLLFGIPKHLPPSPKWHIQLNTGKMLQDLNTKIGQNGRIAFLRGAEDPATHISQIQAHRDAAKGMHFYAEDIPDMNHYLEPQKIFEIFNKMERQ